MANRSNDKDLSAGTLRKGEAVHRHLNGGLARTILLVIVIVTGSLFLAGCGQSVASPTCTTKELVAAAGKGYLKLPPSHDNDVGRGRISDTTPDADLDANQRAALCKVLKRVAHVPG